MAFGRDPARWQSTAAACRREVPRARVPKAEIRKLAGLSRTHRQQFEMRAVGWRRDRGRQGSVRRKGQREALAQPHCNRAVCLTQKDAQTGRPAYGWAIVTDPVRRHELLREGSKEIAKVFIVAVIIDLIYEFIVFHAIYPGQSLIVAATVAVLPYVLIRGSINRIVRCVRRANRASQGRVHSKRHCH